MEQQCKHSALVKNSINDLNGSFDVQNSTKQDKDDANEWLDIDQILNDDEILTTVTDTEAPLDQDDEVADN
ncbi:hypothetical protein FQA39_LY03419 [Lamprigera yunnana]|nr:hypothetical protein FQA39_LY03419 [Lamprigera yunnana]